MESATEIRVAAVVHGGTIMALCSSFSEGAYFDFQVKNGKAMCAGFIFRQSRWMILNFSEKRYGDKKIMIVYHGIAFLAGFVLDLLFGDPHWLPHPIRLIGRLISFWKKLYDETKICARGAASWSCSYFSSPAWCPVAFCILYTGYSRWRAVWSKVL